VPVYVVAGGVVVTGGVYTVVGGCVTDGLVVGGLVTGGVYTEVGACWYIVVVPQP